MILASFLLPCRHNRTSVGRCHCSHGGKILTWNQFSLSFTSPPFCLSIWSDALWDLCCRHVVREGRGATVFSQFISFVPPNTHLAMFFFPFYSVFFYTRKKGSLTEYQHIFISSPATDFLASHAVIFTEVVLSSSSWGGSGQYDPSKWLCGRPQTCEIYAEKSLHLPVSMAVHMLFSGDVCVFRLPFYDPQRNTF